MKWATTLFLSVIATIAIAQTNSSAIVQRMKEIIIPSIEFRQANGVDVLHFLVESLNSSYPEYRPSVSIGIIATNVPAVAQSYRYELEDGSNIELPALTLEYRRISLFEALNRVTEALGLTYEIEGDRILFSTTDGKRIIRK